MKLKIAGIGSFVPAGAAVVGSVALSLLVLHPPPAGLFPGTAPADRGHVASLALPAPPVSRPHATTQIDVPRPTPPATAVVTPRHEITRPEPPPSGPTHRPAPSPPPVVTVPTPVTQPVTTPVTTPTVSPPPVSSPTATPANNGRWSSPQTKVWKGHAVKQALRVEKGRPPWAGPKKGPPPPAITTVTTTATTATTTTTTAAAPDTPTTPPGQAKTPPGQAKKAKSPHG